MEINSNQNAVELSKSQETKKHKSKGSISKFSSTGSITSAAVGSVAAATVGSIATASSMPVGLLAIKGMQNIAGKLSPEQIKALNECAEAMIKDAKLVEKGVKINDVQFAGINFSGLPDCIYDIFNQYSAIAHGKNAAFTPKPLKNKLTGDIMHEANSIIVNKEKMPTALFHEIGHSINYNSSKFWSVMQNLRGPSMVLASCLILFGAFTKNEETKDGKELTAGQKTKNFVRNHSGVLAALSMLPVVSEEIMASVRGVKYANKNLTKDLAKKVTQNNIFGAISYIGSAVGLALAAHLAVKVKDNIINKQKAKKEQYQQTPAKQQAEDNQIK